MSIGTESPACAEPSLLTPTANELTEGTVRTYTPGPMLCFIVVSLGRVTSAVQFSNFSFAYVKGTTAIDRPGILVDTLAANYTMIFQQL
ncbi:hypothetical protein EJB05_12046, partial [Eragrostis curvula]